VSAPEPLSAERRAEIEEFVGPDHPPSDLHCHRCFLRDLLAEVDRLRAITEQPSGEATGTYERLLAVIKDPTCRIEFVDDEGWLSAEAEAALDEFRDVLALLADPVRLPEPEPCCDGDEAITSESEYGPAEYIGFVHAEDCTASLFPEPEATRSLLDAALRGIPVTDPPAELLTIDAVMEAIDGLWEIDEDHLEALRDRLAGRLPEPEKDGE
jgi:hypothetical protein